MDLPFNPASLSTYKRSELQRFCKSCGIKANGKTFQLVDELTKYANNVANKRKLAKEDMVDKEITFSEKIDRHLTYNNEARDIKQIAEATEIRRETFCIKDVVSVSSGDGSLNEKKEKVCKIPRPAFGEKKVFKGTPNKNWAQIHQRAFSRMDSIDEYLKKKSQHAISENIKTMAKTTAEKAKEAIVLMKQSHNTPKDAKKELALKGNSKPRTSLTGSAKTSRSTPFRSHTPKSTTSKPSTVKSSVNNATSLTRKENSGPQKRHNATFSHNFTLEKSKCDSLFSPKASRVSFNPVVNSHTSFLDLRSPLAKASPVKTPKKFDLEQSLKKRLSYKPHVGKLKPLGENYINSDKKKPEVRLRVDVKTARKPITRDERRQKRQDSRKSSRHAALSNRRGLAA